MGDVDGGDAERVLQAGDLGPHLDAQLGVEVRERLVHEEGLRLAHDGPAHRHALALTTGELTRFAVEVVVQLQDARCLGHALDDLVLRHLAQLQREGDVVAHREVGVQGVGLEHHGDVPVLRLQTGDVVSADEQVAVGDRFEPGDHPQGGRLAAAGRPDEHQELAVVHLEIQVVHGVEAVLVDLVDLVERDRCHVRCAPWCGC